MGTHSYYDRHTALFDGALVLYTIRGAEHANWNARIKLPGRKGYIRRSLRTRTEHEAITTGTQLYLKLRAKQDSGLPVDIPTVSQCWTMYLRHREVRGFSNYHANLWWSRYGDEYFSRYQQMDEINQSVTDGYIAPDGFRLNYWASHPPTLERTGVGTANLNRWTSTSHTDSPSYSTMQRELGFIYSWLSFAVAQGYLGVVPVLPNPMDYKARSGSNRGCFSIEQYRHLYQEIGSRCSQELSDVTYTRNGKTHTRKGQQWTRIANERLRMWILLISATGIRPSEARQLEWNMVRRWEPANPIPGVEFYTLIDMPARICKAKYKGRRTGRQVFSFDGAVTYERLMKRWRLHCPTPDDDGLIFPSARDTSKPADMRAPLQRLLATMPESRGGTMLTDRDNLPLSSYSLRHFYITMRILNNVPLAVIAKNCGHTVKTLEQTYNRALATDMVEYLTQTHFKHLQADRDSTLIQ